MEYKVGDRVKIKSLDWYNENKDINGNVHCGDKVFDDYMSVFCGNVVTIGGVYPYNAYDIREDMHCRAWTDEMIEGLVEEETQPKFKVGDKVILDPYPCIVTDVHWRDSLHGFVYTVRGTDFGMIVKEDELVFDERTLPNNSEIIQLIKNDWNNFKDRYDIPDDYHFVDKNGNEINISEIVLEKKKKEYPKTYEECCKIMDIDTGFLLTSYDLEFWKGHLLTSLQKLLICRDAYWEIAGEEMGLGKPWSPTDSDYTTGRYCILVFRGNIIYSTPAQDCILTFPTEEIRDAFYENFKELIEQCKELL